MPEVIATELTRMLGIRHPVILAGMNKASGPKLAAAVSNAGGLGVIGGLTYTPKMLRRTIKTLKKNLEDPNLPWGVDLAIVKVGGKARKTNYDYTHGKLDQLVEVMIEEGCKLFVCAVGVPERRTIDRLHEGGIICMNMVGAPRHVEKAIAAGVDLVCAQGGEGGGHTGRIPTSLLIPACVKVCEGHFSSFTKKPVMVVGAGGIHDGRGLVMALQGGAEAVWVGTRFVASTESDAPKHHKAKVVDCDLHGTIRTEFLSGRPLRLRRDKYLEEWTVDRADELRALLKQGVIPMKHEVEKNRLPIGQATGYVNSLMGICAGSIFEVLPAKQIVDNMVKEAIDIFKSGPSFVSRL